MSTSEFGYRPPVRMLQMSIQDHTLKETQAGERLPKPIKLLSDELGFPKGDLESYLFARVLDAVLLSSTITDEATRIDKYFYARDIASHANALHLAEVRHYSPDFALQRLEEIAEDARQLGNFLLLQPEEAQIFGEVEKLQTKYRSWYPQENDTN